MTSAILDNFIILERIVEAEIERLVPAQGYGSAWEEKARQISDALDRIFLMKLAQNPEVVDTHTRFTCVRINPQEASGIDLRTMNAMLDAKIGAWEVKVPSSADGERVGGFCPQISLREALNISSTNVLNFISGCTLGPLYGKEESLERVEKALSELGVYIIL